MPSRIDSQFSPLESIVELVFVYQHCASARALLPETNFGFVNNNVIRVVLILVPLKFSAPFCSLGNRAPTLEIVIFI